MKNQTIVSISQILEEMNKNISLEQSLLKIFPTLKINRGLPRLYQRINPSVSYIKEDFSQMSALKKQLLEKLLLPLYKMGKTEAKICLFTHMMGGFGDLIAHLEIYKIIISKYPKTTSILSVPKGFIHNLEHSIVISDDCTPQFFPEEALQAIQNSDLIVSLPTYYPHTNELRKISTARWLNIGEYGFVESHDFSPKSGNYSMGLHFLELGILTRKNKEKGDFRTLENQTLLQALFGTTAPKNIDIENYQATHSLYLAYLISPIGGAVYLHALLLSQINQLKIIDICTPDIGWLIQYMKDGLFLNGPLCIQEIEIHFDGKIHRRTIAEQGKKVRIICPGPLSDRDFRTLMVLSEEFIAVRGDQSFSEAVSANRLFFYDGAQHARYFIKDLLAMAENKLSHNQPALSVFRAMNQAFAHNIPEQTTNWVEESYFLEKEPPENIAKKIATALSSPLTLLGFKQFNETILNEYSCNEAICQLVARETTYRFDPDREAYEKNQINAFAEGHQSVNETLQRIASRGRGGGE